HHSRRTTLGSNRTRRVHAPRSLSHTPLHVRGISPRIVWRIMCKRQSCYGTSFGATTLSRGKGSIYESRRRKQPGYDTSSFPNV
ncbi:unnamed protein product, partial [Mycena citricolor]